MKVKYVEQTKKATLLKDIPVGAVFNPIDTSHIYMALDHSGDSEFLTSNLSRLWSATETGYEGEDFDTREDFEQNYDYSNLILCADICTGKTALLFEDIEVELLNCELVVNK
jgi:hypothetical protein